MFLFLVLVFCLFLKEALNTVNPCTVGSAVYVIVLLRGFIPEVFTNACFVSCQPQQVTIPM